MSEVKHKICRRGHSYVPRTKDCPECQAIRARKWYEENLELCKLRDKARLLERKKSGYYKIIPSYRYTTKKKQYLKEYTEKNKDKLKEKAKKRKRKYREECPLFRLTENLRSLIHSTFRTKGVRKTRRTLEILGCSIKDFHEYLKQTAINRYGFWDENQKYHIDHIIPLITGNTEEEVIKLNHYTNLQLLYPEDNLKKGTKTIP